MFLDIPMKTCYTHRFLLLNSHSAAATSRIKGIAAFQVVRFIGVLGRVRKITVFTIKPMDAYGWFIFFLTYIWLWLWRMMMHNDLGNCSFFFRMLNFKKPNGVFATSRGVFATSRRVGTRRPMSPVDPGTCFDFRFHLRKHGEFHGEFTISCGWMLSWMLFLNFNLRNAKNGFGSVEGCLLHSGIRYNPFQESSTAPGFAGFVLDITILGAVRMVDQ